MDPFDNNFWGWVMGNDRSLVSIKDGSLFLLSNRLGYEALAVCGNCPLLNDAFYYQVQVLPVHFTYSMHGMAFCVSENNDHYFLFQVDSVNKQFNLLKVAPDGSLVLISRKRSDSIQVFPNSNTLAVDYSGGQMSLYINGTLADSFVDPDSHACKKVGIYVDFGLVEITADNVYLYQADLAIAP